MGAVNVACCSNSCLGPADAVNCGIATGTCS